jgi:hypothetical protein
MPLFTSDNQPKDRKSRKGCQNTSTILRNLLKLKKVTGSNGQKQDGLKRILLKQIELAELGSVKSATFVLDRLDGKPQQEIKQTEHKTLIVETAGDRPAKGTVSHEVGTQPEVINKLSTGGEGIKLVPPLEDEVETK